MSTISKFSNVSQKDNSGPSPQRANSGPTSQGANSESTSEIAFRIFNLDPLQTSQAFSPNQQRPPSPRDYSKLRYTNGFTPLHVAAARGDIEGCKKLLESLPKYQVIHAINAKNVRGETPLGSALTGESGPHLELVKWLIEQGGNIRATCYGTYFSCQKPLLHWAAKKENAQRFILLEWLIQQGADVNAAFRSIEDQKFRNLENRELMIFGGTINSFDHQICEETLLHWAAKNGDKPLCEWLIKKGADINAIMKIKSINSNEGFKEKTLLHWAVENNDKTLCEFLIEKGAEVNARDSQGNTPLHCAVKNRDKPLCESLLEKGAEVNATNLEEDTPFCFAVQNTDKTLCEFLIEKGAKVNTEKVHHNMRMPLLVNKERALLFYKFLEKAGVKK